MKSINYQMTQLYGVEEHYSCKECAKFDPKTKMRKKKTVNHDDSLFDQTVSLI